MESLYCHKLITSKFILKKKYLNLQYHIMIPLILF